MVGEVKIVAAEPVLDPVRHADQRRAVDVVAHALIHVRTDDRLVQKAGDGNWHPNKLVAIIHDGYRNWARRVKPTFGFALRFRGIAFSVKSRGASSVLYRPIGLV